METQEYGLKLRKYFQGNTTTAQDGVFVGRNNVRQLDGIPSKYFRRYQI